jgi:hypothetical protein
MFQRLLMAVICGCTMVGSASVFGEASPVDKVFVKGAVQISRLLEFIKEGTITTADLQKAVLDKLSAEELETLVASLANVCEKAHKDTLEVVVVNEYPKAAWPVVVGFVASMVTVGVSVKVFEYYENERSSAQSHAVRTGVSDFAFIEQCLDKGGTALLAMTFSLTAMCGFAVALDRLTKMSKRNVTKRLDRAVACVKSVVAQRGAVSVKPTEVAV